MVTTLAGAAGQFGSADGTGSAARFETPSGVAVDSAGNVYVADSDNCEIRKITPAGLVTTLAGAAEQGGSANGTGIAARFAYPTGVAVDSVGNVYVADRNNDEIRKITPAGLVTTLAGWAGHPGYANGPGNIARFYHPSGVAVDSAGNVYVADTYNDEIRKITPAGVVTTLAGAAGAEDSADGTGSAAHFFTPSGVAVDSVGNVYVADSNNDEIRKITPAGGVTTLAGSPGENGYGSADGTGSGASFSYPEGVAVGSTGDIYVADTYSYEIRKLMPVAATSVVTIRSSQATGPMSLGGADGDCTGMNLTDAELARIVTSASGMITIGDATESGVIAFHTAQPATTAGAAIQVIEDPASGGQIILDDAGTGIALDGNGGTVTLSPGAGGVLAYLYPAGTPLATSGYQRHRPGMDAAVDFRPRRRCPTDPGEQHRHAGREQSDCRHVCRAAERRDRRSHLLRNHLPLPRELRRR